MTVTRTVTPGVRERERERERESFIQVRNRARPGANLKGPPGREEDSEEEEEFIRIQRIL